MKRDKWLCLHIGEGNRSDREGRTFILELLENEKFRALLRKGPSESVEKIFDILNESESVVDVEIGDDDFFLSQRRKWAFCILRNEKGDLDKELGITRKHFINRELAKEWRNRMIQEFHPEKNVAEPEDELIVITQRINKIYGRMVGNA